VIKFSFVCSNVDANLKKYHTKLELELKKYREKEKAKYAGMFFPQT
jgi:hypothetical protein